MLVNGDLVDDANSAIQDAYLAIRVTEEAGGNVAEAVTRLNEASHLASQGGEENLREAITLASLAKSLAQLIEQPTQIQLTNYYYQVGSILVVSIVALLFVRKYNDAIYYSIWASIRGKWRIEKNDS
jgi:hypothetical protein